MSYLTTDHSSEQFSRSIGEVGVLADIRYDREGGISSGTRILLLTGAGHQRDPTPVRECCAELRKPRDSNQGRSSAKNSFPAPLEKSVFLQTSSETGMTERAVSPLAPAYCSFL